MASFFGLIVGLFVTMVLIPPLAHLSGKFRMMDLPGSRKIHEQPVPRVGGIAIFVGTLVPLLIWASLDRTAVCYLIGSGIIVLFGAADDRYPLHYIWKFLGQAIAVLVLMSGGVQFEILPFSGLEPVSDWLTYPITFLFVLGITNALNLSDGLDGLAGGSALLGLAGIGFLGFLAGDLTIVLAAIALIGSILGFLRFNTHPAVVFLGDSGSQFLGFSLATLTILLTTKANPALNPMLPLFLVGLPLLDTLSVIVVRLKEGKSPFKADNSHIHHRLLAMGFKHHEAVSAIYLSQAALVVLGYFVRYQSDALVAGVFVVFSTSLFFVLYLAEKKAWRVRRLARVLSSAGTRPPAERRNLLLRRFKWLPQASAQTVQLGIAAFLILTVVLGDSPPRDIAIVSLGVAIMMVFAHFFLHPWTRLFTRVGVYALCLFVVFLLAPMTELDATLNWIVNSYLFALCVVLGLAIRVTRRETFGVTPQDLLMLFFILAIPNLPLNVFSDLPIGSIVLRAGVVFYSSEYVLSRNQGSFRSLRVASFFSLCILGLRGFI